MGDDLPDRRSTPRSEDHGTLLSTSPDVAFLLASGGPSNKQIRNRILAEADACSLRLSTLLYAYNDLAPVNQMPTEVLMNIFARTPEDAGIILEIVTVTHVCRRWRSIILAMPKYWGVAAENVTGRMIHYWGNDFSYMPLLHVCLSRSAPSSIALSIPSSSDREVLLVWKAYNPHFGRLSRVEVGVESLMWFSDFFNVVSSTMRNLKTLRISMKIRRSSDSPRPGELEMSHWNDESVPQLRTLEIPAPYFCRAIAVASLEHVVVSPIVHSLSPLLNALDRCLNLRSLTVRFSNDRDHRFRNDSDHHVDLSSDSIGHPTIKLASLLRLSLTGSMHAVRSFLAQLDLPSSTFVQIQITDTRIWPRTCEPPIIRTVLPATLSPGLRGPPFFDRLYIGTEANHVGELPFRTYCNDGFEIALRGYVHGTELLRFSRETLAYSEEFIAVLEVFRMSAVTELAFDFQYVLADIDWIGVFKQFPALRRLELLENTPRMIKTLITKKFLSVYFGATTSMDRVVEGPTLAWVIPIVVDPPIDLDPHDIDQGSDEEPEDIQLLRALRAIEGIFLEHDTQLKPPLPRLELFVTIHQWDRKYRSSCLPTTFNVVDVETHHAYSQIVKTQLVPRLANLPVDIVVVGGDRETEGSEGEGGSESVPFFSAEWDMNIDDLRALLPHYIRRAAEP